MRETDIPTMVAGDFNARPEEYQIMELRSHWRDAFPELHPVQPPLTCCVDPLTAPPDEAMEKHVDSLFVAGASAEHLPILRARLTLTTHGSWAAAGSDPRTIWDC